MLETLELIPQEVFNTLDLYICPVGDGTSLTALLLADRLRADQPWLRVQTHCGGGSFKSQLKRADKSGARFALLLGEDELKNGTVAIKDLRGDSEQHQLTLDALSDWLAQAAF